MRAVALRTAALAAAAFLLVFPVRRTLAAETPPPNAFKNEPIPVNFRITPEFMPGKKLPTRFLAPECGGANVSPRLRWYNVPPGTKSYLVMFNDTSLGGYYHWVVTDIPLTTTVLPTNAGAHPSAAFGRYAQNSLGRRRYDGPCPPKGQKHFYVVAVYALDVPHLPIQTGVEIDRMTAGHVVAEVSTSTWYSH